MIQKIEFKRNSSFDFEAMFMMQNTKRRRSSTARLVTRTLTLAMGALLPGAAARLHAQGCVAAHSPQPLIAGLDPGSEQGLSGGLYNLSIHGLSVTVGFRTYSSFRHYVGTVYQLRRETAHNEVQNHADLYDLSFNYQMTPRWSIIGDIPALTATRHQQGSINTFRSGGIGDVTVGAQGWIFRPPTENHGNIALSASLKLPTGINDAKGTKTIIPFDESIQPGDGTWGFSLATQAYKETYFHTVGYFSGSWLFSPQDTTGVATGRKAPENVISATDQYLWRGGVSHGVPVPKVRGVVLSFGGR